MKIALVTDAWRPQANGVVITLVELVRELESLDHQIDVIQSRQFKTRLYAGWAGIDLAVRLRKSLSKKLDKLKPDAIYIVAESPFGWGNRPYYIKNKLGFAAAFHTKFPEILYAALNVPIAWAYALHRHFHKPLSQRIVPIQGVLRMLDQCSFRNLRRWKHGVDRALFAYREWPTIFLCWVCWRVAYPCLWDSSTAKITLRHSCSSIPRELKWCVASVH